jgi:hypothetical protein
MNWKGLGRGHDLIEIGLLFWNLPGGNEEN